MVLSKRKSTTPRLLSCALYCRLIEAFFALSCPNRGEESGRKNQRFGRKVVGKLIENRYNRRQVGSRRVPELRSGRRGRRFESSHPDSSKTYLSIKGLSLADSLVIDVRHQED